MNKPLLLLLLLLLLLKPVSLGCTDPVKREPKNSENKWHKNLYLFRSSTNYKGLVFSDSRFQKDDMERLLDALHIPEFYICQQRTHASGLEALMILLRRLVYPNRLCDLADVFGRSISELSLIITKVIEFKKLF